MIVAEVTDYPRFYRRPQPYLSVPLEYRIRFPGARPELFYSMGWGPSAHRSEDSVSDSCRRMSLAEAMELCDGRALEGMYNAS